MCKVLVVSISGYYAWRNREHSAQKSSVAGSVSTGSLRKQSDAVLCGDIATIFHQHKKRYGSPRIHAELRKQGKHHGRKRVARLMKQQGLFANRNL